MTGTNGERPLRSGVVIGTDVRSTYDLLFTCPNAVEQRGLSDGTGVELVPLRQVPAKCANGLTWRATAEEVDEHTLRAKGGYCPECGELGQAIIPAKLMGRSVVVER